MYVLTLKACLLLTSRFSNKIRDIALQNDIDLLNDLAVLNETHGPTLYEGWLVFLMIDKD